MFPKLKKKVFSFLVGEEGKISKQSLLSLSAFLGASAVVGSLSAESVHADACGDGGACACGGDACGDAADAADAAADAPSACACGGAGHASHINDLNVGYSGGTASATHTHHSSNY